MKRGFVILGLILVLSLSFVSASWFSDFFDKFTGEKETAGITGGVIDSTSPACPSMPCFFDGDAITNTAGTIDSAPKYISAKYPYEFTLSSESAVSMKLKYQIWQRYSYETNTMYVKLDGSSVKFSDSASSGNSWEEQTINLGTLLAGTHTIEIYSSPAPDHHMFDWFNLTATPTPTCTPNCAGKTCGSDGCGGSCGTCQSGQICNSYGQCVATSVKCYQNSDCGSETRSNQKCSGSGLCYGSKIPVCVYPGTSNAYCVNRTGSSCSLNNVCTSGKIQCLSGQKIGDVDNDGVITNYDSTLLGNIISENVLSVGNIQSPLYNCCWDVDKNGVVDVTDILYIIDISKGIATSPGACEEEVPTCTDSDGGLNYETKSTCTDSSRRNIADGCIAGEGDYAYLPAYGGYKWLREITCGSQNTCTINDYNCFATGKICKDGTCVALTTPSPTCTDSDGGLNYYVKGNISGISEEGSYYLFSDRCPSSDDPNYGVLQEYSCTSTGISSGTGYNCASEEKVCRDGACVEEELTQEELEEQVVDLEDLQEKVCNGCEFEEKCIPYGFRVFLSEGGDSYCDSSKIIIVQKQDEVSCQNNFECLSNQCSDGKCVSLIEEIRKQISLLWRILCILISPTDSEGRQECFDDHMVTNNNGE